MGWITSTVLGFCILMLVDGFENTELYFLSVPFSILFYSMISDLSWAKFFRLVFKLISNVPKSILEGLEILFFKAIETFEIIDINEDEETDKVLCITLTPKSIVFLSEGDRIHVHVIRR